ncbi:hypothetical protein ACHAP5_011993 [Fusarium lateritium]
MASMGCYKFLREDGALHKHELYGLSLSVRFLVFSAPIAQILVFVQGATETLGLGKPEVQYMETPLDIGASSSDGSRLIRKAIIDLVWRENDFFLKLYCVKVSSHMVEGIDQADKWLQTRHTEDQVWYSEALGFTPGIHPSSTLIYKLPISTGETWRRPGRIWTDSERQDLKNTFSELFQSFFKQNEQELMARIQGGT